MRSRSSAHVWFVTTATILLFPFLSAAAPGDEPQEAAPEPEQREVTAAPALLDLAPEGTCGVIWVDLARLAETALGQPAPPGESAGQWALVAFALRTTDRLPSIDDPPLAAIVYAEPGLAKRTAGHGLLPLREEWIQIDDGRTHAIGFEPFPIALAVSPEGIFCFGIPQSALGVLPCLNPEAERPGLSPSLRRLLERHGDDMIHGAFLTPTGAGSAGPEADEPGVCASLGANVEGIPVREMRLEIELLVECASEEEARAVAAELGKMRDRATGEAENGKPTPDSAAGVAALLAAATPWLADTEFTSKATDAVVRMSIDFGDGEVLLSFLQAFVTHYGFPIDDESEGAAPEAAASDAD